MLISSQRRFTKMNKCLAFLSLIMITEVSYSQQATETGTITTLLIHNAIEESSISQRVRIGLSGTIKDHNCSTTGDWVIDLKNDAAKAQYSLLLASYIAGKSVQLTGNHGEHCIYGQEIIRNISPQ